MHRKMIIPMLAACGTMAFNTVSYASLDTALEDYLEEQKRPNVVMILADDVGYTDLGAYGSEIETPNIDALAENGVKFSNFHVSASCAPSRAMILTGVDHHLAGVPTIPESMPPEQAEYENYDGVLSSNVATVATILGEDGYHTYMAGKWHLGKEKDQLPYNRGFERTLSMADTGADNWEQRPYMPMYDHSHWTRDGNEVQLDQPFYSSELLVDEMIGFIDSNLEDGQPFFAYLPFLAVHIPVQAPKEYTDMYLETYTEGWEVLRETRHASALEIGLVPEGSGRVDHEFIDDWDALSPEEQRYEAKRMAVYAGMMTAMDDHIGRLVAYLEEEDQLDNTVFIVASDNGPEYSVIPDSSFKRLGYTNEYETLGEKGSANYIGQNFANAAASPLSYFKFYAGEGGLRVPLIISGAGIEAHKGFQNAFAYATDITPTILAIAGVEAPEGRFGGREIEPIIGKDLTPILNGKSDTVYMEEDYVGYEVAGNAALFNQEYKIVRNQGLLGDSEWYMYDIVGDPGETKDLKSENPIQFQRMLNQYQDYVEVNGVQPVPDHYSQDMEIMQKSVRNSASDLITTTLLVAVTLMIFGMFGWQRKITR